MNYRLFWFVVLTALWGCENDGLEVNDVRDMEVPEGFVLSAGTSTIFKNSSYAYDTDADWVADIPANSKRFTHGDRLYDNPLNWARYMRVTPAARATVMQAGPSRAYGHRTERTLTGHPFTDQASMVFQPCWYM